jgi:hypothetical protein
MGGAVFLGGVWRMVSRSLPSKFLPSKSLFCRACCRPNMYAFAMLGGQQARLEIF